MVLCCKLRQNHNRGCPHVTQLKAAPRAPNSCISLCMNSTKGKCSSNTWAKHVSMSDSATALVLLEWPARPWGKWEAPRLVGSVLPLMAEGAFPDCAKSGSNLAITLATYCLNISFGFIFPIVIRLFSLCS